VLFTLQQPKVSWVERIRDGIENRQKKPAGKRVQPIFLEEDRGDILIIPHGTRARFEGVGVGHFSAPRMEENATTISLKD
jgi:hypothetical protein